MGQDYGVTAALQFLAIRVEVREFTFPEDDTIDVLSEAM
jgi:hypothetical protein